MGSAISLTSVFPRPGFAEVLNSLKESKTLTSTDVNVIFLAEDFTSVNLVMVSEGLSTNLVCPLRKGAANERELKRVKAWVGLSNDLLPTLEPSEVAGGHLAWFPNNMAIPEVRSELLEEFRSVFPSVKSGFQDLLQRSYQACRTLGPGSKP